MDKETFSKNVVNYFLDKDILISADLLGLLPYLEMGKIRDFLVRNVDINLLAIFNKELLENLKKNKALTINWVEFDRAKTISEKTEDTLGYDALINDMYTIEENKEKKDGRKVKIISNYTKESTKRTVQDFVSYFNNRYKAIEQMLRTRKELNNLTSISRLKSKQDKEKVSIIGMVFEKNITKNDNIIVTLEDSSTTFNVLFNKNNAELYDRAKNLVEDEVIGVSGMSGNSILFANELIFPDIPTKELKKSPDETYAVFMGDTHFGSTFFLKNDFLRFLKWLNGELGDNNQKELIKKIKYLFILGDVVEGVGIYPGQEEDLEIKDIFEQYDIFIKFLKKIPKHITVIVCAGNHDAMRISEPQPILGEEFSKEASNFSNVIFVSNPSMVNIGASEDFPGFDVLLYHGYSFTYFADNVESIRLAGGQTRPDLLMNFLLQKRHLAPTHTSTLYIPDVNTDPLVIDKVPDFFVTGHIHRVSASSYRNITTLNCSSWLSQTDYQEKVGLEPQPGRVLLVNLQTRNVKIMKFIQDASK